MRTAADGRIWVQTAALGLCAAVLAGPGILPAAGSPSAPVAAPAAATTGAPARAAAAAEPSSAPALTAEEAFARVVRPVWARDPLPSDAELDQARRALEAAATREPGNVRWAYGLAHVARIDALRARGDATAAAKRKQAKELFEKVVERSPGSADDQFWYGDACFEMIDDVGFLSKASLASSGRKAFEKAIELDPGHVAARYALGIFFSKAPSIAGGSTAKAKEQGEALLKLPGGRGEYWGRMLLARIAAADKDWAEMSRQYTAAETAKGEGADPIGALQNQIVQLLNVKKDPAAALPVIARYRAAAKPDDVAPDFFEGDARRQLGQYEQAAAAFERVLARTPEARNSRFLLAECYEKLGNRAEARKNYDEFARRFPADDRAAKAKDASKRLG